MGWACRGGAGEKCTFFEWRGSAVGGRSRCLRVSGAGCCAPAWVLWAGWLGLWLFVAVAGCAGLWLCGGVGMAGRGCCGLCGARSLARWLGGLWGWRAGRGYKNAPPSGAGRGVRPPLAGRAGDLLDYEFRVGRGAEELGENFGVKCFDTLAVE